MLTSGINLIAFKEKKPSNKIKKIFKSIVNGNSELIKSFRKNYKNSFDRQKLKKYKKYSHFRIIGMGGSIIGTQTIYDFLKHKIKKKFLFVDNLKNRQDNNIKKKFINLVVSKSGNTIETIINTNILIKKK